MQPAPSYSTILALHVSTDRPFDALAYTIAFSNILHRKHAFRSRFMSQRGHGNPSVDVCYLDKKTGPLREKDTWTQIKL